MRIVTSQKCFPAPLRNLCPQWKKDAAKRMRKAMTPAEGRLWAQLRCNRLGVRVRRQVVIRGYIADFYIAAWNLIVEVDGSAHNGREAYDTKRDADLARIGWRTLRFTNDQVFNQLGTVVQTIMESRS